MPIRNANLIKTMAIAISVGARKRRSTKPSRTPFRRPTRFQSNNRRRAGAPVVPDPFQRARYRPKGSGIIKFFQANEVLRRHRHLLGLQVRNDRRAGSSSAARLKRDRTPERCSRGLRRAPLPGAYAYRYRHHPDEVCVWDRQSFRFL